MKTLDEVIKSVETHINDFDKNGCFECHYCGDECCIDSCFLEDALHYLKEYQEISKAMNPKVYIPDGYKVAKIGDKNG